MSIQCTIQKHFKVAYRWTSWFIIRTNQVNEYISVLYIRFTHQTQDNQQECFKLNNWCSLHCLGPCMNHLPPLWWSTLEFMFCVWATCLLHRTKSQKAQLRLIQAIRSGQVTCQELGQSNPSTRWGSSPTSSVNLSTQYFSLPLSPVCSDTSNKSLTNR